MDGARDAGRVGVRAESPHSSSEPSILTHGSGRGGGAVRRRSCSWSSENRAVRCCPSAWLGLTWRAPRRATFPHFLAWAGSGSSSRARRPTVAPRPDPLPAGRRPLVSSSRLVAARRGGRALPSARRVLSARLVLSVRRVLSARRGAAPPARALGAAGPPFPPLFAPVFPPLFPPLLGPPAVPPFPAPRPGVEARRSGREESAGMRGV